jgi:hypothetical protein
MAPRDGRAGELRGRVPRGENPPLEPVASLAPNAAPAALDGAAVGQDAEPGWCLDLLEGKASEDVQPVLPLRLVPPQGPAGQRVDPVGTDDQVELLRRAVGEGQLGELGVVVQPLDGAADLQHPGGSAASNLFLAVYEHGIARVRSGEDVLVNASGSHCAPSRW